MSATTNSKPSSSAHDAEVRLERRERVVGDLGLGRRDAARSACSCPRWGSRRGRRRPCSLSSSRSQRSSPTSPCSAKLGARRRLDRKRALPRPPRPPSAASQRSPAWTRSASTSPSRVVHDRALGHGHHEVVARPAPWLLLALAVGAARGPAVRVVPERQQRGDVAVGDQPDVAALAAVAAVGPALGHVGLAPERHAAGAAVTAFDVQAALVDELGHAGQATGPPAAPRPVTRPGGPGRR